MRKDAEEADEADVNKEEAKKRQRMPMKKPKMLQIMIGMKLGPESKCFVHLNPEAGNMINPNLN